LATWLGKLASGELLARLAGCSLWWPQVETGEAKSRWGSGLPTASELGRLLGGL
jgi:hypothetical protein